MPGAIAVALAVSVGGCSFYIVKPEPDWERACRSPVIPAIDVLITIGGLAATAAAARASSKAADPSLQYEFLVVAGLITAFAHAASAFYGFDARGRCRDALKVHGAEEDDDPRIDDAKTMRMLR